MKFYCVSYSQEGGNSAGYTWHTNYAQALKFAKADYEKDPAEYDNHSKKVRERIELIEITPTKAGILDALRQFASHANNG